MNAAEKLEEAIAKLTAQQENAVRGPWVVQDELWHGAFRHEITNLSGSLVTSDGDGIGSVQAEEAALIVTLHRTIDVQLGILRMAWLDREGSHDEPDAFDRAVELADAILGVDS